VSPREWVEGFLLAVFSFLFVLSFHKLIYEAVMTYLKARGITDPLQAHLVILLLSGIALVLLGKELSDYFKKG